MLRTLHGKLSLALLGLLILVGLLTIPLTLFTNRLYLAEVNQRLNRSLAHDLAGEMVIGKGGDVHPGALRQLFSRLMAINPSIEVYLLDGRGNIRTYSAPPGKVKRKRVALAPVRRFLGRTGPLPILGDDPRDPRRQKVFSAAPLADGGYVYVILGGEQYDSVAEMLGRSYILRLGLGAMVGGLLFVLVTGLLLFHLLTRRLRRLTQVVESFQEGDFTAALAPLAEPIPAALSPGSPRDEMERLGLVFAGMARRIQEQLGDLRRADAHRRELVSNVSHDLRTPLAALQGYLETLLMKEGRLTREEQREYLTIAARHGERLGSLVAELFELAKLDAGEARIQAEPFSPGELVQDVAQKYQIIAEKKRLTLRAQFDPDPPFVRADIALVERVLEKLIENALRHTGEGGVITLTLGAPEAGAVPVRVSDTGQGIRPEDLPFIFDRSFRGDKDRSGTGGAGLGLAIAKRIIDLHHSALSVASVVGEGTTFTFPLPICDQNVNFS